MRVAIIYRQRDAAPPALLPMLMGALGQWVERYSTQFSTLEFFAVGGGLALADIADSTALHRIVAENPFTPYMDVEIMPVVIRWFGSSSRMRRAISCMKAMSSCGSRSSFSSLPISQAKMRGSLANVPTMRCTKGQ